MTRKKQLLSILLNFKCLKFNSKMKIEKIKISNKTVMPFTIPSGIITTEISSLERIANEIPEVGILTTKSIGPEPRAGNCEPILAQYMPGGFINAVGLTNPGAEEFANKLSSINFPETKFLLASIFGKDADEFVYVAKTLENSGKIDGFELNLSCPHAKGLGMQLGQDPDKVAEITKSVSQITKKPIFAKLTPNTNNIGEIAKSAISAGAYGITAINTVGPEYYSVDGHPVLTNQVGGLSGAGILPIGLKRVRDIRNAVGENIPIIGMGGIAKPKDVREYAAAGANIFGIGSALAGMDENNLREYFSSLVDCINNPDESKEWRLESSLNDFSDKSNEKMKYRKVTIKEKNDSASDFKILKTNEFIRGESGQFVFAWIPGIGEKPFSIMDNNPLTLGILEKGEFTKAINSLKPGDSFYVRGPYGKSYSLDYLSKMDHVLVGGGCGIAGISLMAKSFSDEISQACDSKLKILLAAKDKEHIFDLKIRYKEDTEIYIATEDGSRGIKGKVIDLFEKAAIRNGSYFFNCGPKAMIDAILPLEMNYSNPEKFSRQLIT